MLIHCTNSSVGCEKPEAVEWNNLPRCEENEQYGRILYVRITDIKSQKNESAEDIRNLIKSIIAESGCDIPDIAMDRAHRIGKNDPSRKIVRLTIVILTTFGHRAMFFWAAKNLSKKGVHLDLTKGRFTIYQKARDLKKFRQVKEICQICLSWYELSIKS